MEYFYLSITGVLTYILYVLGLIVIGVVFLFIIRNSSRFAEKVKFDRVPLRQQLAESSSIQGVIMESAGNISNVIKRSSNIYTNAITGLATQDRKLLKKNKKSVEKLSDEIDELRDHIYYYIKNIETPSESANSFYINILGYLKDISQSLEYISKVSYKYVKNKHKKLKFNQIKELKEINELIEHLLEDTQKAFKVYSFDSIADILKNKEYALDLVTQKIHEQIERTQSDESSPKSATLYFGLLLETRDLLTPTMKLLEEYYKSHDKSVSPAVVVQPAAVEDVVE